MRRALLVMTAAATVSLAATTATAAAASKWVLVGTAHWVKGAGLTGGSDYGIVTTSSGAGTYDSGTYGEADLNSPSIPTTNPKKINALSYYFNPEQSGPSGGSPRMVVCFSDSPTPSNCDSNGELGPMTWATPGTWTFVNGFAASDGVNNVWINAGGTCGPVYNTTWSKLVACHPGATITQVRVVNDSGWEFPNATDSETYEQISLDNLRVNGVVASAP